jgi:myo-inositol-1(or 4)-monophosphatase
MDNIMISDSRLDTAVRAARCGGDVAQSTKDLSSSELKDNGTVVTEADCAAEREIRYVLGDASPYPVLGEEQGGDVHDSGSYWVVDPIDGTRNFSYGQPLYGTAVALIEDGEPTVGVFYMPELEYLFYAVTGKGAYLNDSEISVTSGKNLEEVNFCLSGRGKEFFYEDISRFNRGLQVPGSAVMCTGMVASGWCDIGVFGALAPWDVASGVVFVREAGGKVMHAREKSTDWGSLREGHLIFGSEELVDTLSGELSKDTIDSILGSKYNY